jgi:hypothetical protein
MTLVASADAKDLNPFVGKCYRFVTRLILRFDLINVDDHWNGSQETCQDACPSWKDWQIPERYFVEVGNRLLNRFDIDYSYLLPR